MNDINVINKKNVGLKYCDSYLDVVSMLFYLLWFKFHLHSNVYVSGARIWTVTEAGPGVVGDLRVAERNDVAECPLLALEPR